MQLVILVGCRDHRSLLRFPRDEGVYHGYTTSAAVGQSKASFVKQFVCEKFEIKNPEFITIHTYIENSLPDVDGEKYQLVVVEVSDDGMQAPEEWPTLPIILRSMEKGKGRLAYNKAMQVYAGGLSQEVDALEVDEEVRQRLRELDSDGKL